MFVLVYFWNPPAEAASVWLPTPTLGKRYAPAEFETACLIWPVEGLVSEIDALGIRAPVASVTVPLMVALSWPQAPGAMTRSMAMNAKHTVRYLHDGFFAAITVAMCRPWIFRRFMVCLLSKRLFDLLFYSRSVPFLGTFDGW